MEIGTAEPITKEEKRKRLKELKKRRSDLFSGNSGSSNNGGGGDGGDGDEPGKQKIEDLEHESGEKSRVLMYFLLLVVLMTFGGLIGAYVVISTNNALEWRPFSLPFQVWISTVLIAASSVTYYLAESFLRKDEDAKAKKWFFITTALGAAFISSQIMAWLALVNRGLYMRGNPYAGFFYLLTAIHALHVLGGILALGYVILRNWNATRSELEKEKREAEARSIGWYWHTMGALWLVLLFLLGFWK